MAYGQQKQRAELHPGLPRTLLVRSSVQELSGPYDIVVNSTEAPLWRMRDLTNAEISLLEGPKRWQLRSAFGHAPLYSQRMTPLGYWDDGTADGTTIEAAMETPSLIGTLAFPAPRMDYNFYKTGGAGAVDLASGVVFESLLSHPNLRFLITSKNEQIPAIHRTFPEATVTILYSHGNAEDLGFLLDYIDFISEQCKASVLAYDYVGYSLSRLEGEAPSEAGCYRSIQAAWDYLTKHLRIPPQAIVLYGRSIGSGPTCELASSESAASCAGVVLESPIASGASAVAGLRMGLLARPLDIFVNRSKVGDIKCPVAIMHGTADDVVPWSNGQDLYDCCQACSRFPPFWVEGRGHNNMPPEECLSYVARFIDCLADLQDGNTNGSHEPFGDGEEDEDANGEATCTTM